MLHIPKDGEGFKHQPKMDWKAFVSSFQVFLDDELRDIHAAKPVLCRDFEAGVFVSQNSERVALTGSIPSSLVL